MKLDISAISNWHISYVAQKGTARHTKLENGIVTETFPARMWPGDGVFDHMEFALKNDGINLSLFYLIFRKIDPVELKAFILEKPISQPRRRIWFLFEFLLQKNLDLPDIPQGNYIELVDSSMFFTLENGERTKRHRVINNLLGNPDFCPFIRKTDKLVNLDFIRLSEECSKLLQSYSPAVLKRALGYLYTKETKSSFEIEHLKPSPSRIEKFIALLSLAENQDFCAKAELVKLQNLIVDERFADDDFRTTQNYVGQSVSFQNELVHFVCPKPKDIHSLMSGLISSHQLMNKSLIPALIHAAVIAYAFVFMHPFNDGNGRIHRFLIHNILARRNFTPKGLMLPVSATMLKNPVAYDHSLEVFSKPILQQIEYTLTNLGEMTVENETAHWYRYIDATPQAEALVDFIQETISHELAEELNFVVKYDNTKAAIQEIIDLPDRQIDLFINLCAQNNGDLSEKRKEKYFNSLTDIEIQKLIEAVKKNFLAIS
jgi:hypothetical protein